MPNALPPNEAWAMRSSRWIFEPAKAGSEFRYANSSTIGNF